MPEPNNSTIVPNEDDRRTVRVPVSKRTVTKPAITKIDLAKSVPPSAKKNAKKLPIPHIVTPNEEVRRSGRVPVPKQTVTKPSMTEMNSGKSSLANAGKNAEAPTLGTKRKLIQETDNSSLKRKKLKLINKRNHIIQCSVCEKKFTRTYGLNRHIKVAHPIVELKMNNVTCVS